MQHGFYAVSTPTTNDWTARRDPVVDGRLSRLEQRVEQVASQISDLRVDIAQARAAFWMNLLKGATVVNVIVAVLIWSKVLASL